MASDKRQKVMSWGISVAVHLLLFVVIALTGLFAKLSAEPDKVLDVTLYEMETAAAGSAGAAGSEAAESAETAAGDDMAVTVEEKVWNQSVAAVRAAEEQAAAKPERAQAAGQMRSSAESGKAQGGTDTGKKGQGNNSKEETGTGAGEGKGNGEGSDGRDNAAAERPSVPPQLIAGAAPAYPEGLRQQGIEGAVRVRVVVDQDGNVENATVAASSGYEEMDAAAVAAAYRYRFTAARNRYGDPVRCAVGQTVQFRLQ